MRLRMTMLAGLAALAACTTPAQKITARLVDYGVPPSQARCMGDRLQQRLSFGQLQRLGSLSELDRSRLGRMSINDITRALNRPGDEVIVAEVVRAGIGCVI